MSIRAFYDQWPQYNRRMVEVVAPMTDEQLGLSHVAGGWPIWATVGHTAGARVYWLCQVAGEPGIETTPFPDPENGGWEDDLDTPRGAAELVTALQTTFVVVEGVLDRWTPGMMGEPITRRYGGVSRDHTRTSILQRLFSHDAYHCGELSQTLGILDLPQIDLWRSEE
jgi:uncharacterized damage-inducible protein DinB